MIKKLKNQALIYLLLLLLIPSLIFNLYLFQKSKKSNQGILVIEVLDGDTLLLEGKVRLRLRHIDAPEVEFCGGKEAKAFLENFVKDKRITIKEKILDQRGRAMALVYVNHTFVNKEILQNGWARWHHDKSSQQVILKKAADQAKKNRLGIFSPQCYQTENLENPDCLIKGNIDKVTGVKKYYFPGCAQYDFTIIEKDIGEQWFCSEAEAQKAGFEKSKTCFDKKYTVK